MVRSWRLLAVIVVLVVAPSRGVSQEPVDPDAVPFSCEPGAVSVDISRSPGVRFVPAERPEPIFPDAREFAFTAGAIRRVRLFLWATLPEGGVGRGSEAVLHVVAETSASGHPTDPVRWWRLAPAPIELYSGDDRAAQTLRFDAKDLSPCFNGEPCQFAELTPAADAATALLVLAFTRDLGGANANNWEHARLVLDFRADEPRVGVAVTCGYNEGGGACTAFDSGTMARSDLSCPWDGAAGDFACAEVSDQWGHRDFRLLSGQPLPARAGELPTLEAAALELARGAPGPLVVTGLSPVRLVHEAALGGGRVLVFAAGGRFHVAERTAAGLGPLTALAPRGLAPDPDEEPQELPGPGWTSEGDSAFDAAEMARTGSGFVLRIVESAQYGSAAPARAHTLFWLGIERTNGRLRADLLTLVSPGAYAGCGRTGVPTVVTAIRRVATPLDATVDVQPPTVTNLEGEVIWRSADLGDDVRECGRPGRIRWRGGRFDVAIGDRACRTNEAPFSVDVAPGGSIRRSSTVREP